MKLATIDMFGLFTDGKMTVRRREIELLINWCQSHCFVICPGLQSLNASKSAHDTDWPVVVYLPAVYVLAGGDVFAGCENIFFQKSSGHILNSIC